MIWLFAIRHTQQHNGKLAVNDAENAWFIRVDGVTGYGDDPFLEKITINPGEPLLFLNIDTRPGGTALDLESYWRIPRQALSQSAGCTAQADCTWGYQQTGDSRCS